MSRAGPARLRPAAARSSASTCTSGACSTSSRRCQHVDLGARDEVYHTCRTLLVHRHEDLAIFDRAFDAFWRGARRQSRRRSCRQQRASGGAAASTATSTAVRRDAGDAAMQPRHPATTWSDAETLAHKDFAAFTRRRDRAGRRAIAIGSHWNPGERRTRRWVRGRGPRIDLRRALARSVRTGGDVVALPRRRRRRSRGRSCCSATSAARWSATRACSCTSPTRWRAGTAASRRSSSRRADARHRRSCARRRLDDAVAAGRARGARLVGRHAHRRRRCGSSISAGRAACCTAARSCC